ncbi:MAG: T9SS C-terminal target domain-containing protein [Bacteroidetes bacterium]|nr:MAG: T9SS C-terminal target domain-containing protein [Bacteroidota bacterium]
MKTISKIIGLLLLSIVSFSQNLTFSPASGTQVIAASGGSFRLQITQPFPGGISLYNFNIGISSSSSTQTNPTITLQANNGPARTLKFNIYGNGVTYDYVVSQLGINCTTLSGVNPTSITGNINPCLNETVTYSLPTLSTTGTWYNIKFGNIEGIFYDTTTDGGNFNVNFTFTGLFDIQIVRRTNCFYGTNVGFWGNVNVNPSNPTISGMNTFTTGSPINFTSTLESGESNIWRFNSNTFTGTAFSTTLGIGLYTLTAQNFNGNCPSSLVSRSFTVKSRQTIAGISSLLSGYTYPVPNISLANVTASSGLPVSVVSYDPSVISISGNAIYFLKAGVTTITASQAGNSQYFAAPPLVYNVAVSKGSSVVSVTSSIPSVVTVVGTGTSFTVSGLSSVGSPLQYSLSGGGIVTNNVITLSQPGTFTLTVSSPENEKYQSSTLSFVINVVTVAGITNIISNEYQRDGGFEVYPNPSTGTFTTKSFGISSNEIKYVEVFSIEGIKITNLALGVAQLPKGIYILKYGTHVRKLILE